MHCNLTQPGAAQSLSALILSPVSSLNSLSLSVAVLERFYCLVRYAVTLNFDPVTLSFDLVWCARCAVVKLCTKFERNRAIRGRVIAV